MNTEQDLINRLYKRDEEISQKNQALRTMTSNLSKAKEEISQLKKLLEEREGFIEAKNRYLDVCDNEIKRLKSKLEVKASCDKSCSPSDYHKGGKCYKNGCFEEVKEESQQFGVIFKNKWTGKEYIHQTIFQTEIEVNYFIQKQDTKNSIISKFSITRKE